MKIGDRVLTQYGEGTIVKQETFKHGGRFEVELDDKSNVWRREYGCNPAFWKDELTKIKK